VRIRATEGLLYIESIRSHTTPECAGSWITVRRNRRVTVTARADGSSKYACNSVVSLSENMDLCSHLHIIFIPFNASSDRHFHTHCMSFHALEYRLLQVSCLSATVCDEYSTNNNVFVRLRATNTERSALHNCLQPNNPTPL
jgi:hypothetical protein